MSKAYVGISGWTYAGWRGVFYPQDVTQKRELQYASRQLNAIEINGTFYSLQRPTSFETWYEHTPRGFRFAVKGSRFITHMKQLRDWRVPLANFFRAARRLARGFADRAAPHSHSSTMTPRCAPRSTPCRSPYASTSTGEIVMQTDRIAAFLGLLEKNPADTRTRFGLALEYEKQGRWADAAEQLELYLRQADDEGNAWGRLGHALRQLGRDADAHAAYRSGIQAAQRHGHPTMALEFEELLDGWAG